MISVTDRLLLGAAHSELVTDLNPITDPIQFLEWYRTVPGLISEAELVLEFRALLDRAFSRVPSGPACADWRAR